MQIELNNFRTLLKQINRYRLILKIIYLDKKDTLSLHLLKMNE